MNMKYPEVLDIETDDLENDLLFLSEADVSDLKLRKQNLLDLKIIQKMYSTYEEEFLSLDEVLTRVLEFYRKFVPYK